MLFITYPMIHHNWAFWITSIFWWGIEMQGLKCLLLSWSVLCTCDVVDKALIAKHNAREMLFLTYPIYHHWVFGLRVPLDIIIYCILSNETYFPAFLMILMCVCVCSPHGDLDGFKMAKEILDISSNAFDCYFDSILLGFWITITGRFILRSR